MSVLVVGVMMFIAGVAELINAFQVKNWGKFFVWAPLGALYIVAGFVTFENHALAAAVLTLILGGSLVAAGIMRVILGFSMKRQTARFWLPTSGVITMLVGLLILARWPINSVYILGLFLGLDLIVAGASWIGISFRLRRTSIVSQALSPA
ncbi:HdeD family acid-resistance protein [Bradyrhizobium sp. CCBAU 051011]|uniref:HdeD family acid-resistance protein n=1 Tax=Bradyrhizobium sp. CCBAU 051011 TaxID=858422 RepID=UPI00352B831B